ncbi:2-oxoglutarate and iron-dependent oxygenase domain-containing protein [Pigmentiphaga soli]|uniref:2-oxoglutarate and iron-dependent oxygenase domain-containing protein n=1 Tax=Pigmentiphaga soli TaxID=1007095 RepID=A0ABP8GWA3_9BURK
MKVDLNPMKGVLADTEEELRLMDYPDSDEEIPVLDLAPYLEGSESGRAKVARELGRISQRVGFFYVKNHGVPQELVDNVFTQARRFHSLPEEVKAQTPHGYVDSFQTGYVPMRAAGKKTNVNIVADAKPNLLAKFLISRELPADHPDYRPVNKWPENLPGFRDVVKEYALQIEKLGRSFLPLWAVSLDLRPDYFDRFFTTPHLTVSLLHYPPQESVGDRQYGIAPHTDNSFMTLLAQSSVPGLAVRMPSGHWRVVENIPGTFLINTGNVMVRWTNGRYLSTKHRVINSAGRERYSVPVFFGPSGDAVIECVPTCVSPENPPQYETMTYRELRQWYYNLGSK